MKKVKKFFKRLGKTRFLILFFIPFGAISFYHNGLPGLIAAIIGYSFGYWLCENKDRIKKFEFKKFFRRYVKAIIHLIVYGLMASAACHFGDWRHVAGVTVGYVLGLIIWRVRHGRW